VDEVLASHQAYYQLRVCQEAVWEAFRIFFDRIPGTAEYQRWVHTCQQESLCISDLARNFSSADEHMRMVHRVRGRPRPVSANNKKKNTTVGRPDVGRSVVIPRGSVRFKKFEAANVRHFCFIKPTKMILI
uniref:Interphotoreceptor matrix proteoglycan 1a n=1 Tax=Echeneis naucrates TaxID=173247 RepID=A0A665VKN0_ECHNA